MEALFRQSEMSMSAFNKRASRHRVTVCGPVSEMADRPVQPSIERPECADKHPLCNSASSS